MTLNLELGVPVLELGKEQVNGHFCFMLPFLPRTPWETVTD